LHFGIDPGSYRTSDKPDAEYIETIDITITNLGGRPALLDLRTLEIRCETHVLHPWQQDHWGPEERELLLAPNEHETVRLPLDTFRRELKIESPGMYDEESFNRLRPVQVRVQTTHKKLYESKQLRYWEATGEFHRG
jgi:hypothetical protein